MTKPLSPESQKVLDRFVESRMFDRHIAIATLLAILDEQSAVLKRHSIHKECDDSWYSCPLSQEGCADDSATDCICGANIVIETLANTTKAMKELGGE